MPKFRNRNEACDVDIERKCGFPDWNNSKFCKDNLTGEITIYTSFENFPQLFRIDNMKDLIRGEDNAVA